MKCKKCNSELKPNVRFCEHCGSPVELQTQIKPIMPQNPVNVIPPIQQKKKGIKVWQIVLLSIGGFFALIGMFFTLLIIIGFVFGNTETDTNSSSSTTSSIESFSFDYNAVDERIEPETEEPTTEEPTTIEPTTEKPTEDPAVVEENFKESCETIDFDTLSRNPDKYKGNNYKFTGEVIQVQEGWFDSVDLRINVTEIDYEYLEGSYWEDTIYATITIPEGEDNILEDDVITIWGTCDGEYTYEAVLGNKITLPKIDIKYYELVE